MRVHTQQATEGGGYCLQAFYYSLMVCNRKRTNVSIVLFLLQHQTVTDDSKCKITYRDHIHSPTLYVILHFEFKYDTVPTWLLTLKDRK